MGDSNEASPIAHENSFDYALRGRPPTLLQTERFSVNNWKEKHSPQHAIINMLFTIFIICTPWLGLSALAGLLAARKRLECQIIYAAIAGYFSYVIIAFTLTTVHLYPQTIIKTFHALSFICVFILFIYFYSVRKTASEIEIEIRYLPYILTIILYFLVYLYLTMSTPIQGWDVLHHWTEVAINYHTYVAQFTDGEVFSDYNVHPWDGAPMDKHPVLGGVLLAWSALLISENNILTYSFLPWLLCMFSCVMAIFSLQISRETPKSLGAISVLFFLAIPLLENHVVIAGYLELQMNAAIILAFSAYFIGRKCGDFWLMAAALWISATPIFLKNSGFIYFILFNSSALIYELYNRGSRSRSRFNWRKNLIAVAPFFACLGLLVISNSLLVGETGVSLSLFGRNFILKWIYMHDAVFSLKTALFSNSSFTLLPILAAIAAGGLASNQFIGQQGAEAAAILFYVGAGLLLISISLFSAEGLSVGAPGSDTSFSRALMPVLIPGVLLIGSIFSTSAHRSGDSRSEMN